MPRIASLRLSYSRTPSGHPETRTADRGDQDKRRLTRPVRWSSQLSVAIRTLLGVTATLIGYARCSTEEQDLTAQRQTLLELGVGADRIYLDRGLTGTNRRRPGLDQALTRAGHLENPQLRGKPLSTIGPERRPLGWVRW